MIYETVSLSDLQES